VNTAVVLATHNEHKVSELQHIVDGEALGARVQAYAGPEPVEDGTSFDENALIKARAAARHTGMISLADDSGLCVDVMGGAPGIFSAIWCGVHGRDDENVRLLLAQLRDIPDPHRTARFHCSLAIVVPEGVRQQAGEYVVGGDWPGRIASAPRGRNGFGYDPIFIPEGEDRTSAELAPEEKNAMSHRARAFRDAMPLLRRL
jgi:XTP/dITP diphosphohydrolase